MRRFATRVLSRASRDINWIGDNIRVAAIRCKPRAWPCNRVKYLVVGCESSGTTVISHLLFNDGSRRFLLEGAVWAWDLYMSVYQGKSRVRDYPRLQIYDGIKVPGFAAILDKYIAEFPRARIVYIVRDPRDVVSSAYRSKHVRTRDELRSISWVRETWLGIESNDPVERLALRWRRYLEVSQRVPDVCYVRYEDFCSDKVGTIQRLGAELGVHVDAARVTRLCDIQASHKSVRAYEPRGPDCWRREFVSPADAQLIERVCGDLMMRWNYHSWQAVRELP